MKKLLSMVLSLGLIASASFVFADTGAENVDDGGVYTLEEMLQYAYEDEAKALAEYDALIEKFGEVRPFTQIIRAEARHLEAVTWLYDAYGLEVPTFDASAEVVLPETLEEAYAIGVQAEIDNIEMYKTFLSSDLDDDAERIFEALTNASEHHLNAFKNAQDGNFSTGTMGMGRGRGRGNRADDGYGRMDDDSYGHMRSDRSYSGFGGCLMDED